ncbi:MAG: helix-turn-helix transcriptional regulator [Candidatus Micrarchaeota archaeon]
MKLSKNRLRECREKEGMTQEALAQKLGVTRQTIISIESGKYVPSLQLALLIAKAFGTSVEGIFGV